MLPPAAIVGLALAVVLGSLYRPLDLNIRFAEQQNPNRAPAVLTRRALLVTAHPDDEAMFFAPTILALNKPNSGVSLFHVCLSNGDSEGLGKERKAELEVSLDILGIPPTKRWLLNTPDLKDNFTATWDAQIIAKVLQSFVVDLKIDTILTFDGTGVSGHPNHISIPAGASALIENLAKFSGNIPVRLFVLDTVAVYYKYSSIIGAAWGKVKIYGYSFLSGFERLILDVASNFIPDLLETKYPRHIHAGAKTTFVSSYNQYLAAKSAMNAHKSQMVWFRQLYVLFSQYMWVNTWTEVEV